MMPKKGDKFLRDGAEGRVMAVAEGWIMARLKGCMPFVMNLREFEQECELFDT